MHPPARRRWPTVDAGCRAAVLTAVMIATSVAPLSAQYTTWPLLFDADMTVGASATVTTTLGAALARVEDRVIPNRLLDERGIARRTTNATYRFLKLVYLDIPQEEWLLVVNHEIAGHGARLRERFDGPIGYEVDAPVPYGSGGGTTFFEFDREPTPYELMLVSAAGMEVNAVSAALIADRAFVSGRLRVRDGLRYLGFELDTFYYVRGTGDEPERRGHDVSDFLRVYNEVAEVAEADERSPAQLRREVLVGLANPMLVYAVASAVRYVWSGNGSVPIRGLSVAGVEILPMMRYRLTPFGTEHSVVTAVSGRRWPTAVEVRWGRSHAASPWAVGVERQAMATWRRWHVDAGVEIWHQPRTAGLPDDTDASSLQPRLGGRVRGRFTRAIDWLKLGPAPMAAIVDVGIKTEGYAPGEPLRSGLVVRVGVGIPLGD